MNQTPPADDTHPVDPQPHPTTTEPSADANTYQVLVDGPCREDLLTALHHAAKTTVQALDCAACAGFTCTEDQHVARLAQVRAWRGLAADISRLPAMSGPDEPLIRFDADACRAWLLVGAADEACINEGFNTEELTIAAGLEELLGLLNTDSAQQAWRPAPHVHDVLIWRTADGDGVDGGGVLTVDLNYMGERVRLASLHQGYDDFTGDAATSGIDAATEALGHVANTINREYANFRRATACPPPADVDLDVFTVVGVWIDDEPVPVGVIAGDHQVSGGDEEQFPQGVWATCVTAADDVEAEQVAIAALRDDNE